MDQNKIGIMVENAVDETNFILISSKEMGSEEMAEKIQKLEDKMDSLNGADQTSSTMQIAFQIDEKFGKIENKLDGICEENLELKDGMAKIVKALGEMKEQIGKLVEEMTEKGREMEEIKKEFAELKAVKDEEKENVQSKDQKLVQVWANDSGGNGNRWNVQDCGQKLAFRENARIVINVGSSEIWNTIRGEWPVPKINLNGKSRCISGYYEVQIVERKDDNLWHRFTLALRHLPMRHLRMKRGFRIGFCDKQFPLEDANIRIGEKGDSIGIKYDENVIVNGSTMALTNNETSAGKFFNKGNVIGCGLLYSPDDPSLKCFVTLNGKLLGSVDLPLYFADIVLYPAASLWFWKITLKANFRQETWRFNPAQLLE